MGGCLTGHLQVPQPHNFVRVNLVGAVFFKGTSSLLGGTLVKKCFVDRENNDIILSQGKRCSVSVR